MSHNPFVVCAWPSCAETGLDRARKGDKRLADWLTGRQTDTRYSSDNGHDNVDHDGNDGHARYLMEEESLPASPFGTTCHLLHLKVTVQSARP